MKSKKIAKSLFKNIGSLTSAKLSVTISAGKIWVYLGDELVLILKSDDCNLWYCDHDDIFNLAYCIAKQSETVTSTMTTKNAILILYTIGETTKVIMRFKRLDIDDLYNNLFSLEEFGE